MTMNYVEIEGKNGLIRDITTGAIINTNRNEKHKILSAREKRINDAKTLESLTKDVEEIKQTLSKIITFLEKESK